MWLVILKKSDVVETVDTDLKNNYTGRVSFGYILLFYNVKFSWRISTFLKKVWVLKYYYLIFASTTK